MHSLFEECKANINAYDALIKNKDVTTVTLTLTKVDIDNLIYILNAHSPNWQAELIARDIAHRVMRQAINATPTNKE